MLGGQRGADMVHIGEPRPPWIARGTPMRQRLSAQQPVSGPGSTEEGRAVPQGALLPAQRMGTPDSLPGRRIRCKGSPSASSRGAKAVCEAVQMNRDTFHATGGGAATASTRWLCRASASRDLSRLLKRASRVLHAAHLNESGIRTRLVFS